MINYVVVDWGKGAKGPDYWGAAANTPLVGAQLGMTLALLWYVVSLDLRRSLIFFNSTDIAVSAKLSDILRAAFI